jgi:lysophospholipase L1-like esterase
MKLIKIINALAICLMAYPAFGQHVSYRSFEHYNVKVAEFEHLSDIGKNDIVMLGNSLTEYAGDWNKLFHSKHVVNRGIAGDTAMGIYHRLNQILSGKPKAIFLMVGINDLSHDYTPAKVASLAEMVINRIRVESPTTKLYVQSLLPIDESTGVWKTLDGKTNDIPRINRLLRIYCKRKNIEFINLFPHFVRHGTNQMRRELTKDGLHLTPMGYKVWTFVLDQYIKRVI